MRAKINGCSQRLRERAFRARNREAEDPLGREIEGTKAVVYVRAREFFSVPARRPK